MSSVQNTYHENREPADHAMPPGGFRLGIINCTDLGSGFRARRILAAAYPSARLLLPKVSASRCGEIGRPLQLSCHSGWIAKACRVILDRPPLTSSSHCLLLRCMAEAPGIENGVLDNHLHFGRASGSPRPAA